MFLGLGVLKRDYVPHFRENGVQTMWTYMKTENPAVRGLDEVLLTRVPFRPNDFWRAAVAVRVGLSSIICKGQ